MPILTCTDLSKLIFIWMVTLHDTYFAHRMKVRRDFDKVLEFHMTSLHLLVLPLSLSDRNIGLKGENQMCLLNGSNLCILQTLEVELVFFSQEVY